MKNTKIFALVATVALLVIGAAFTSFAAQYNWYQQDDEWRCKDKNGDDYYDAWAKSGADWYWLNDEGFMAREALVDEDTKYVDADGKMVKNDWKKIADDEGDEYWYYFQAGGKKMAAKEAATAPKPVTINGKKYIFDVDGKMLSGWVGVRAYDTGIISWGDLEEDFEWQQGAYYCGDEEDGAVTYGWRQIECYNDKEDFVDNNYWFYFDNNGKKVAAKVDSSDNAYLTEKTINGKKYAFNEYGVMKAEWEQTQCTASVASASASSYAWFHTVEDGSKLANGWFRVVPSDSFDYDNNYDETAKWFYAKSGTLYTSTIKTIAGKKYGFNAAGEMITGLQLVTETGTNPVVYTFEAIDNDTVQLSYIDGYLAANEYVYYFSDDEDNDGSMKTGAQKVTVDGDDYDFYFSTKNIAKGQGITGKQGNKYYFNGKKVAADDSIADYLFYDAIAADAKGNITAVQLGGVKTFEKVWREEPDHRVKATTVDGYALVSKTGAVATSGTKKDGNGYKATYKKENGVAYWVVGLE